MPGIHPTQRHDDDFDPVIGSISARTRDDESSDFDALADLFLTDDPVPARASAAPSPPKPVTRAPQVEAARVAPRLEPARAAIELLVQGHLPVRAAPWISQFARACASDSASGVALIRLSAGALSVESFGVSEAPAVDGASEALRWASHMPSAVVVLDEIHQADLLADPRVDAITLLCGTDDAAIVAAYRTLKAIAPLLPEADGSARLGVALVADDQASASSAFQRLEKACSVFLARPLRLRACITKIAPTGARAVYRGEEAVAPADLLRALASNERPHAETPRAAVEAASASFASLVPGLTLIAARCPEDAGVELAIDRGGVLHLLLDDSDPSAVERLLAVFAWATRHRALIDLTLPEMSRPGAGSPVRMHLLARAPKRHTALLHTDVRVHAFIETSHGGATVELN